jgi:hypothetical protein
MDHLSLEQRRHWNNNAVSETLTAVITSQVIQVVTPTISTDYAAQGFFIKILAACIPNTLL